MRSKKKNRIFFLLILLLGISIGFAALSTTLKINGSAGITKNNWSVYWANPVVAQGSITTDVPELSAESGKTLNTIATWSTTLNLPGDFYEFTIDAVNNGSIDAMIDGLDSVITDVNDEVTTLPPYIKYTVTYVDNKKILDNHLLSKNTTETYKIRIEFLNTITPEQMDEIPEDGLLYNFTYEIPYVQATTEAIPRATTLENDDWSVVIANIKGDKSSYNIGETKTIEMDMNGDNTPETYTLRVANNTTPAECSTEGFSQTACGFVFEFVDIIDLHIMNPRSSDASNIPIGHFNKGGWEYSNMRAYLNNNIYLEGTDEEIDYTTNGIFNKLPDFIKNAIIDTRVVSGHGPRDSSNFTTEDEIYLLSAHEVWEDTDGDPNRGISRLDTAYNNSRQLDYYKSIGVTTTNYTQARKHVPGSENANDWWLRTTGGDWNAFLLVTSGGGYYEHNSFYDFIGVSPAFRVAE